MSLWCTICGGSMSASGSQSPSEDQSSKQSYVFPDGKIIPNTVFVGGIDGRMDEYEIREYFSKFGAVKDVKIITDRAGLSKGYGFVSYHGEIDVDKIIASQMSFHGKKLKLGPAIRKHSVCSHIQPRPVVISNPAPPYPNMWNAPVSDPYVHHPPVYSPVTQYVQPCPYSNPPVLYPQQPGYFQVPPQWPNGDQRSFVFPQAFTWNYHGNESEMLFNESVPPEIYIHEQNLSPVSTSPQKKVDRGIQTLVSCLLTSDGRLQRSSISQDDYVKDRRVQYRRSRPVIKPTFD
ncbi:deleted in azoospermia-like [Leptodactylus fuscus]|uniref:deleted in azoospermia-like n=1 Tax=Leptodactylus fuscus TaxID=238119 RepID=UPI003F4E759C